MQSKIKLNTDYIEAVKNNNIEKVNILLDKGADINFNDALVIFTNSYEMIKLLLDRGADINIINLYTACKYSNTDSSYGIVKMLLDRGANINSEVDNNWTALLIASRFSNNGSSYETVKLLLDRGANINSKTNDGITSIMFAAGESNNDSTYETFQLLLDRGADINIKDNVGNTALIYATKLSNKESSLKTVELLLEKGADPFVKNNAKKSAYDFCPTYECKTLLAKYIWKHLYKRDVETARKYSKSTVLPKDVWELILLNKRQQQLCNNLSSPKKIEVLLFFAQELNIPIKTNITKAQIGGKISRSLAYGKYYSEKSEQKVREDIKNIKDIASRFGLDRKKPIEELLRDLSHIVKN
jgi:ankyrin repeat protein